MWQGSKRVPKEDLLSSGLLACLLSCIVGHVLLLDFVMGPRWGEGSPPVENKPMAEISSIQIFVQTNQCTSLWGAHLQWVDGL